jgi:hypothetical protein
VKYWRRAFCTLLSLTIHVAGFYMLLDGLRVTSRREASTRDSAALIATVFMFEEKYTRGSTLATFVLEPSVDAGSIIVEPPELPRVDAVAADSFSKGEAANTVDDLLAVQRLQGIYKGQIEARVSRILESSIARHQSVAPCILRVIQDERGQVLEVQTDGCEADAEWRDAISQALMQASPLPLPPEGLAMGSYLTLDMSSL